MYDKTHDAHNNSRQFLSFSFASEMWTFILYGVWHWQQWNDSFYRYSHTHEVEGERDQIETTNNDYVNRSTYASEKCFAIFRFFFSISSIISSLSTLCLLRLLMMVHSILSFSQCTWSLVIESIIIFVFVLCTGLGCHLLVAACA